jgi:hypothetical protein
MELPADMIDQLLASKNGGGDTLDAVLSLMGKSKEYGALLERMRIGARLWKLADMKTIKGTPTATLLKRLANQVVDGQEEYGI